MFPGMKMMPGAVAQGQVAQMMVDARLKGWNQKYGSMADNEPYLMIGEPTTPAMPERRTADNSKS